MAYIGPAAHAVPSVALEDISPERFHADFYKTAQPVVIRGSIPDWGAHAWGVEYFGRSGHDPLVQVLRNRTAVFNPVTDDPALGRPERFYMRFSRAAELIYSDPGAFHYMRQIPLDGPVKWLSKDVGAPPVLDASKSVVDRNLWFGGAGCKSPLHFDKLDNFLIQVKGSKRITLFAPEQSANVYPSVGSRMPHVSRVNSFAPDFDAHPLYRDAHAARMEALIGPGDTLYIPPTWWHAVESLETSISVNCWWDDGSSAKAGTTMQDRLVGMISKGRDMYLLADWLLFRRG